MKRWITSATIFTMNICKLSYALDENKTIFQWNSIIVAVLARSLQSALGCRIGELIQTKGHTGSKFLAWKDVAFRLPAGAQSADDFEVSVKLCFIKRFKDTPNQCNQIHKLKAINDSALSSISCQVVSCPRDPSWDNTCQLCE